MGTEREGEPLDRDAAAGVEEERLRELVARAANGERDAVEELYRLYRSQLVDVAHARLGRTLHDLTESIDLVQSVWKDLLVELPSFEYRGPGSFPAWLRTCLIHKIETERKYFAAAKRDAHRVEPLAAVEGLPSASSDPTPSQAAASTEELARLAAILERFPRPQRQALLARLRDDCSFAEIGERLGCSEDAARKLYQRGLAGLIPLLPPEWRRS